MDSPLAISLFVTGVGMLTLFLALALLYGLMYLMTALIRERLEEQGSRGAEGQGSGGAEEQGSRGAEEQGSRGAEEQRAMKRRVAVVAVALARAERERNAAGAPEGETAASPWRVSAWRALHHQRQLTRGMRTRGVR
jgi:Na+-transporting methylmalonyl-CoA/oxaloacetate decarboxylase gamma subunit